MADTMVVYYSLTGQTYAPGGKIDVLEKGHTQAAAEFVAEAVGGDLYGLDTVRVYAEDHMEMIKEAQQEHKAGIRPELKSYPDPSGYTTVFLGFPNWFETMPMPVRGYLERFDWSGKRIIPFVTSGGGGLGRGVDVIREVCAGARVDDGKHFLGHEVESSGDAIRDWARSKV